MLKIPYKIMYIECHIVLFILSRIIKDYLSWFNVLKICNKQVFFFFFIDIEKPSWFWMFILKYNINDLWSLVLNYNFYLILNVLLIWFLFVGIYLFPYQHSCQVLFKFDGWFCTRLKCDDDRCKVLTTAHIILSQVSQQKLQLKKNVDLFLLITTICM
jgi:hypothetical protein